jgi:hypothetical protein
VDEKQAEAVSWAKNGNLGRFTNFVNLMDMAAVAVPSGIIRCQPIHAEATGMQELSGLSRHMEDFSAQTMLLIITASKALACPSKAVTENTCTTCLAAPVP